MLTICVQYLQRPGEDIGFSENKAIGSCELPGTGAGN